MLNRPANNHLKPNNCPYCGYFCNAARMIQDEKVAPEPGDLSFCLKCAECSQFDENLKFIKFDLNQIKNANEYARLIRLQEHMKEFLKQENLK